jgi:hypothetical protein
MEIWLRLNVRKSYSPMINSSFLLGVLINKNHHSAPIPGKLIIEDQGVVVVDMLPSPIREWFHQSHSLN